MCLKRKLIVLNVFSFSGEVCKHPQTAVAQAVEITSVVRVQLPYQWPTAAPLQTVRNHLYGGIFALAYSSRQSPLGKDFLNFHQMVKIILINFFINFEERPIISAV